MSAEIDALRARAQQSIDDLLRLVVECETRSMAWHVENACPACGRMLSARDALRDLLAAVEASQPATDRMEQQPRVDRFEVIDEDGRAYVRRGMPLTLAYQDGGRTLKVFIPAVLP